MNLTTEFIVSDDVAKQLIIKDGVATATVVNCSSKSLKLDITPPFSVEYNISFTEEERKVLTSGATITFNGNKAVGIIPSKKVAPAQTQTKQGFSGKLPQG